MSDITAPNEQQVADAINWLVKFESGELSREDLIAFERWRAQNPQNALAWQRLGYASRHFAPVSKLSSEQALQSLNTAERIVQKKRRTLKTLVSVGGVGLALWLSRDYTGVSQVGRYLYSRTVTDIVTAVGEQTTLILEDGSQLTLNTQSALDIDFSTRPELALSYGELSIQDSGAAQLRAGDSLFSPLAGSEFTLFHQKNLCRLQVVAGQVACIFNGGKETLIKAGQGLSQQSNRITHFTPDPHSLSWRQGLLTAERTRLGSFVAQLARYRPGYLGCAEAISGLTLSGSFPISDTDAVLDNLSQILPIRQQRISRYWVRLVPA